MSVESAGMVVVDGGLRLLCLSTAKSSGQGNRPKWLKLGALIVLFVFASRPSASTSSWELSEILQH